MRLSTGEMAAALGLSLPQEQCAVTVRGAATDNREVKAGDLFVCVRGERVDGHDYAAQAVAQGAAAVLASRPLPQVAVPVLLVEDTVKAMGRLAALWRSRTTARVVALTGTAGKTSVKEVLARTLAVRGKTACTAMNHNNQIGMPRTILNTDGDEDFWVIEAGISHEHDMPELASIIRPDLALILNVGAGHTEGLGDKGVAWHKACLLEYLAEGGRALVSADYPDLVREARARQVDLHFFSAEARPVEYRAAYGGPVPQSDDPAQCGPRGRYRLWLDGKPSEVISPFSGSYGAENSIAVAAAAHMLGLTPQEISEGMKEARLPQGRFSHSTCGLWQIVDDAYNANPLSMQRMLETVAGEVSGRPFIVVLGEMGELGAQSAALHEELGKYLAGLRPAAIFWKGGMAEAVRAGLNYGGYDGPWQPVGSAQELLDGWQALPETGLDMHKGGLVFFKGSHSNHLEVLVTALQTELAAQQTVSEG